jgi:uncharacterized protein (TIRG00374 family)
MTKNAMILLAKYVIGISLVVLVFFSHWNLTTPDQEEVGLVRVLSHRLHWPSLILSCLASSFSIVLAFLRWYLFVRAQNTDIPFRIVVRLGMLGLFLNTFLPGGVAGDAFRAIALARQQSQPMSACLTVLGDRLIGLFGLFFFGCLTGCFFWFRDMPEPFVAGGQGYHGFIILHLVAILITFGGVSFWVSLRVIPSRHDAFLTTLVSRLPVIGNSLADIWHAIRRFQDRPLIVLSGLILSVLGHIGLVCGFFLAATTLYCASELPPLWFHFLLLPVALVVQAGFPTPGGLGGSEFACGYLYHLAGFSFEAGFLAWIVRRCTVWALALTSYLVYLNLSPLAPLSQARPP